MGKEASGADESFERGLLEHPHFTRPREWEGRAIPDVLLKGDHAKIAEWRRREAERNTRERRPDLSIPSGVGERTRIRLTHPARSDASEDKGRSVIASRHRASRDARLFRRALAAWRSRRA